MSKRPKCRCSFWLSTEAATVTRSSVSDIRRAPTQGKQSSHLALPIFHTYFMKLLLHNIALDAGHAVYYPG
jgi:hypothetical protein